MQNNMIARTALLIALVAAGLTPTNIPAQAALFTPVDVGQTVNGFQDDFSGTVRDPNWVSVGQGEDLYAQSGGVLVIPSFTGDPNHLLYEAPGYDPVVQEVLARMRVTAFEFSATGVTRGGVAVGSDPDNAAHPGQALNLHFRDTDATGPVHGRHAGLLDDYIAWGPQIDLKWVTNTWYWLRLRQTGTNSAGVNMVESKFWPADGSVAEPGDWQATWARSVHSGFAGLAGGSGGISEFEVDYVLIKAAGLPSIKVAPSAFPIPFYLSIVDQPQDTAVGLNQTASFTVQAASSSALAFQWQRAAPGTSTFSDISGATTATLTTAALTAADNGAKYRAVISGPGTALTVTSREAQVTVDDVPPALVYARTLGNPNKVTVVFSEDVASPVDPSNFSIDNGVTINAVAQGNNARTFEIATSALKVGTTYVLTLNGIRDLFGNKVAPNTTATIDLSIEVPLEFGQTVNGYQDDFDAAARNPLWVPVPAEKDAYEQTNGLLRVTVVGDNPGPDTHLLYSAPGYSDTVQEVLARIRITNFGTGDAARCGVAVAVDADSSQGINLHFRDNDQDGILGRQFKLLDDRRAWGPGYDFDWENNTWYWLRLRQTGPTAPDNINGKVWKADGTVPEPDQWQLNWGRDGRVGLAGIVGSSIGGLSEYEVDYILIKADGLPATKVAPAAFGFGPYIIITQNPSDAIVPPGQSVTLNVAATGSSAPTFQWQKAGSGTSNFVDVAGATTASLTIPSPTASDSGAKYRAVITIPGLSKPSREAVIITDIVPPTLVSARTLGNPNKVTVVFSEDVAVPANPTGFSIDNGITVNGVVAGSSANILELTTSALALGKSYKLTASGVNDLVGNAIAASSQIAIDFSVEVPSDVGKTVNGFQDDFTGATRDPNWVFSGPAGDLYEQTNGVLKVTASESDPNHLLYTAAGYSDAVQEVLARIKINAFGEGDFPRAGISVGINTDSSQGINLMFRNSSAQAIAGSPRHFRLLDDARAWGPGFRPELATGDWKTNTWYWLRLRQTASTSGGGTNIQGKVWLGDGTVPEPDQWQLNWGRDDRTGFAGIAGSSGGGGEEFEVDYILIKAEGLPSIQVTPSSFSLLGPPPAILKFTGLTKTTGNQYVLEWIGTGILEQGDTVKGPWTVVTGAVSPLPVTATGAAKFYRLHQ